MFAQFYALFLQRKARTLFLLLALVSGSLMSNTVQAQEAHSIDQILQAGMQNTLERAGQVGNAAIVMQNGKIIASSQNGLRRKDQQTPVGPNDKWHIGSITKSMTATMLGRLADKGDINLEAKLVDFVPEDKINLDASWQSVRLIDLLTHTSGAAPNFDTNIMLDRTFANQSELDAARFEAVKTVLENPTAHPARSKFEYSNIGYTIAATLVASHLGKSYEELMHDELFEPLKLKTAGFGAPKGENPWGHGKRFLLFSSPINPETPDADNTPIIAPAGTVHMSLTDLATYGDMHAQLNAGTSDFLSTETAELLHTPSDASAGKENYAAGLVMLNLPTEPTTKAIFHNGSNTLWYAFMMVVPEEQLTIVMSTNVGDIQKSEQAFFELAIELINAIKKAAQ
jgi:CubicO group peptidase (beta-lactamase class C family)